MQSTIHIRKGEKEDVHALWQLVAELATFEKAGHELINTPEQMLKDGFGTQPLFQFWVAEIEQEIIGIALCYYRYSTWKGKVLYLEDLVVKEQHRKKGVGKKLISALIHEAKKLSCQRICWQVLDWNQSAIDFYNKWPVQRNDEWINMSLEV